MALSLKEVDQLVGTSKQNQVKLCVIHNMLFEPVIMKARATVDESAIGDLVGVDIKLLSLTGATLLMNRDHWCHQLPGGIFIETLPHAIYLAEGFLGNLEPIALCSGKSGSYDWVVADEIGVILSGQRGMATIAGSCNTYKDKVIIDVYGTKKNLRIDLWNSIMTQYSVGTGSRPSRALKNLSQGFSILAGTVSTTSSVISGTFHSGHYTLIRRFIESIQNNKQPPVTLEEAKEVVRVLEKITAQI